MYIIWRKLQELRGLTSPVLACLAYQVTYMIRVFTVFFYFLTKETKARLWIVIAWWQSHLDILDFPVNIFSSCFLFMTYPLVNVSQNQPRGRQFLNGSGGPTTHAASFIVSLSFILSLPCSVFLALFVFIFFFIFLPFLLIIFCRDPSFCENQIYSRKFLFFEFCIWCIEILSDSVCIAGKIIRLILIN